MELWEAVGAEWDRALSGDVTTAFETASRLLESRQSPDDRAVLLAFRAFCELTGCDYLGGARHDLVEAKGEGCGIRALIDHAGSQQAHGVDVEARKFAGW